MSKYDDPYYDPAGDVRTVWDRGRPSDIALALSPAAADVLGAASRNYFWRRERDAAIDALLQLDLVTAKPPMGGRGVIVEPTPLGKRVAECLPQEAA